MPSCGCRSLSSWIQRGNGFADSFAQATAGDRPVQLFRSLHDARKWMKEARGPIGSR